MIWEGKEEKELRGTKREEWRKENSKDVLLLGALGSWHFPQVARGVLG